MSKNIFFNACSPEAEFIENSLDIAKNSAPAWYKSMKPFHEGRPKFNNDGLVINKTARLCQPFEDSLFAGYMQKTWQEIYINADNDYVEYYYPNKPDIMSIRERHSFVPSDFYKIEFVWNIPFWPEVPNGYSVIFCHPLNRYDLPFYTSSGIVDCDNFTAASKNNNLPFFIKNNFSGKISIDTPMYQLIPIKRDNWNSFKNKYDEKKSIKVISKIYNYFWLGYKKNYWKKKIYK